MISLVPSSSNDRHFVVETDELGRSTIRFGNGVNGENVPTAGSIQCTYQTGSALEGNVGSRPHRPHRTPQGRSGLEPVRRHRSARARAA